TAVSQAARSQRQKIKERAEGKHQHHILRNLRARSRRLSHSASSMKQTLQLRKDVFQGLFEMIWSEAGRELSARFIDHLFPSAFDFYIQFDQPPRCPFTAAGFCRIVCC